MGVFTKLTIHKRTGDQTILVSEESPGAAPEQACGEILYRVNLTMGMHNAGEVEKADDDPTKDIWTIETD